MVPWLTIQQEGGKSKIIADPNKLNDPREVTVALVALHVVFTLQDHPEFIWSTFEHLDPKAGEPDIAPSAKERPPAAVNIVANPQINYLLYKAGLEGNKIPSDQDIVDNFDIGKQSFTKKGTVFQTSVFRVYPASKSNTDDPDDEVAAVNKSMADVVFKSGKFDPKTDKRNHYRLVGATWMNDPRGIDHADKALIAGKHLRNPAGQDPDAGDALVTGEEHLSSTAMESFTQSDPLVMGGANKSPNCFFCHDTAQVSDGNTALLNESKINVSHVLSRYLLNAPSSGPEGSH